MFLPEQEYLSIAERVPICCVDLLIQHKSKLLLVHRKSTEPIGGVWATPGGRIYKNETWDEAVKRKASEELGLQVNIVQQLKSYVFFIDAKIPSGFHTITTLFLCELCDPNSDFPEIRCDDTMDDVKWVGRTEKIENVATVVQQMLEDAVTMIEDRRKT